MRGRFMGWPRSAVQQPPDRRRAHGDGVFGTEFLAAIAADALPIVVGWRGGLAGGAKTGGEVSFFADDFMGKLDQPRTY